ncbi:MAG: AAA family ATPase [Methanotrichaceae archaeon]
MNGWVTGQSKLQKIRYTAKREVNEKESIPRTDLIFELNRPNCETERYEIKKGETDPNAIRNLLQHYPLSRIEKEIPDIRRIGQNAWRDIITGDIFSFEDLIYRHQGRSHFLDRFSDMIVKKEDPQWLVNIKNTIKIYFIETERLYVNIETGSDEDRNSRTLSVLNYSKEIGMLIQANLAKYGEKSQSMDRTFPFRLINITDPFVLTPEKLKQKLNELEDKRLQLVDSALLDTEDPLDPIDLRELFKKIDESNRNVLSVYIKDVEDKLGIFDELNGKIILLKRIINNRFRYKKMLINKQKGFVFKTNAGDIISPSQLSSGEQHELVMLFELLFKVSPDSLILIDEPEISLHILWQQQFLKDLQEITTLGKFDVIIATHSPEIIYNRDDLAVELSEHSDVRVH